ncbi:hypothetical protein CKO25_16495 [Thiocapsa imhoffii]|uniref:Uncharacterized protein n=1 Tax=Thiocapsa imhoffii TaxID=382777 RepID=A0A9X0WK53_9GAMM|nr:hypothetical protein [Thiocapsa imhoffii]MBK1646216.1 hypothetical protein [Thiocapsa imhoffii]
MLRIGSLPYPLIALLGVCVLLVGHVGAVLPPDAVEELKDKAQAVLEVKVLEVIPDETGGRFAVHYRMNVLSVLRSTIRVKPGDIIEVRSDGIDKTLVDQGFVGPKIPELLEQDWIGTAYLNLDPQASDSADAKQFVIAAYGDSFVTLPPGPPSLRYRVMPTDDES